MTTLLNFKLSRNGKVFSYIMKHGSGVEFAKCFVADNSLLKGRVFIFLSGAISIFNEVIPFLCSQMLVQRGYFKVTAHDLAYSTCFLIWVCHFDPF